MVFVVRKDAQVLDFVYVDEFGLRDDFNASDWPDSNWNVRQFLCLGVGCSHVY